MNVFIYSFVSNINYNNVKIIKIFENNNNSYSIMNNHISSIKNLNVILFYYFKKVIKINFFNGFYIQKKKNINIICKKYEFL
ncbi:hypothetical protein CUN91_00520 [Candidatus Carsonella ruddii]|uniref:ATP synthase epsilon chain n=1 Tax=Carsonella ruddii TaxID=114186 RepID=A0A2K8K4B6_CARRU|nr:hypothetical protein [Candidatus Carsonella ruddii]ATX33439.1 hypothetical protein CUN91_00520 [Candidatus Carsonella ruddii]